MRNALISALLLAAAPVFPGPAFAAGAPAKVVSGLTLHDIGAALSGATLLGAPVTLTEQTTQQGSHYYAASVPEHGDVATIIGIGCADAPTAACEGVAILFLRAAGDVDAATANTYNQSTPYAKMAIVSGGRVLSVVTEQSVDGATPQTVRAALGNFERGLISFANLLEHGPASTISFSAYDHATTRSRAAGPRAKIDADRSAVSGQLFGPAPYGAADARRSVVNAYAGHGQSE